MKKTFSILVILLMIGSISFANIVDVPRTSMIVLKNGVTFKLCYRGLQQGDIKVFILNNDNQVIFSEKIKNTAGFVRPYNFSKLPEGNYSIRLAGEKESFMERVVHENSPIKAYRPIHMMRVPGTNKFILSVPNKGKEKVSVTIYDERGSVVHEEVEDIDGDFAKIYNIKPKTGRVTFVVSDSKGVGGKFSKTDW